MTVTVGSKVLYVPEAEFALDRDRDGRTCWLFAYEEGDRRPFPDKDVGTLTRQQGRLISQQGKGVAPSGPRYFWPGVVAAANEDGTCELDVRHPNGCATLHLPGRKLDQDGKRPGTFHLAEREDA